MIEHNVCTVLQIKENSVIHEIFSGVLKYQPSMELLFQSNRTLIPMRSFDMDLFLLSHEMDCIAEENENGIDSKFDSETFKNSIQKTNHSQRISESFLSQLFFCSDSESEELEMIELPMNYKSNNCDAISNLSIKIPGMHSNLEITQEESESKSK